MNSSIPPSLPSKQRDRFINLLRELFQLNQPDLDFGLYRIMHAKSAEIEKFLSEDLLAVIANTFGGSAQDSINMARASYERELATAKEYGAADPDNLPKVQQARTAYEAARDSAGDDAEIYDHLYRFFERYYDQGDFLSRRYYARETHERAAPYSVPYDGSEVYLHWANKDQYYIKTSESFNNYSIDLSQARDGDAQTPLFGDATETTPCKLHFKLVEAEEGEHNNVKATVEKDRFFMLDATPIAWQSSVETSDGNATSPIAAELVLRFQYRADPDKTGNTGTWRDKRNAQSVELILAALQEQAVGNGAHAKDAAAYHQALAQQVGKGAKKPGSKQETQPLLARYLHQYTAKNTMDYFIHKDLGGFLKRELDFYIKNEVMRLDDLGTAAAPHVANFEKTLKKLHTLRSIAHKLVEFLAQIEDFQKKLWLKKKFVIDTQWLVTLDKVPPAMYAEIAANGAQWQEWDQLGFLIEPAPDLLAAAKSGTLEYLQANPTLVLDTQFFDAGFTARLLASIDNLDDATDGVLVHSENFQALNLMQARYREQVKCIYIDPPYNTGTDDFKYKDRYQHSTWLAMMFDRMRLAKKITMPDGVTFSSIGNDEIAGLKILFDYVYGESKDNNVIHWKKNQKPQNASRTMSESAEYVLVYFKDKPLKLVRPMFGTRSDEGGSFKPTPLFTFDGRDRRTQIIPKNTIVECAEWKSGTIFGARNRLAYIEVMDVPVVKNGILQNDVRVNGEWRKTETNGQYQQVVAEQRLFINKNGFPNEKSYRDENSKNVHTNLWLEAGYNELGKMTLDGLFGVMDLMSYPKPIELCSEVFKCINDDSGLIFDFFAGSGTSAHAVINLN